MIVKLLGYQNIDFTSNQGDRIVGTNLFVSYPDNNVKGLRSDRKFASRKAIADQELKVDSYYDVSINFNGKVEKVSYYGDTYLE